MRRRGVLDRLHLSPERIADHIPVPSRPPGDDRLPLNTLCRPEFWDDPAWRATSRLLGLSQGDDRLHRKIFEWVQCVYGLDRLGVLTADAVVLGVGAGHECVIYHVANVCRLSIATDLYAGWFTSSPGNEADPVFLHDPDRFAPFPYRRDRLRALPADGLALPFPDDSVDVVYSLSSIEHFGSHEVAGDAMREIARVLKPGGTACIATEYILEGGGHPNYFVPEQLDRFVIHGTGLVLVEPFDATPPPRAYIDDPIWVPDDVFKTPHLVLGMETLRWTSCVLFFRKPHLRELWRAAPRSMTHRVKSLSRRRRALS